MPMKEEAVDGAKAVPVGRYSYSQELIDMLRAAYRRYACECHFEGIERALKCAPHLHEHYRFFEMVARADASDEEGRA